MSDLNAALAAIRKNQESIREANIEKTMGAQGPRGPEGQPGRPATIVIGTVQTGDRAAASFSDTKTPGEYALNLTLPVAPAIPGDRGDVGPQGAAGPVPQIVIGRVTTGDKAAAQVHYDSEKSAYVFDFTLPRGERGFTGADGAPSTVAGPRGLPGRDSQIAGPPGESIVGPTGPKGEPGMTIKEIQDTIIEVLTDAGVVTEQVKKLVAIRVLLKKKALSADTRHAYEMSELVKQVDKMFDAE